ncbi:MAG: hypothetical protein Q9188_004640, partial [Gyalolechia gomerana]
MVGADTWQYNHTLPTTLGLRNPQLTASPISRSSSHSKFGEEDCHTDLDPQRSQYETQTEDVYTGDMGCPHGLVDFPILCTSFLISPSFLSALYDTGYRDSRTRFQQSQLADFRFPEAKYFGSRSGI